MLLISPDVCGKGIGAMLAAHAIKEQGASRSDVNEQNEHARFLPAYWLYSDGFFVPASPSL